MSQGLKNPEPAVPIRLEPILLDDELVEENAKRLVVFIVQRRVKHSQIVEVSYESESFGTNVELLSNTCFFKQFP